MIPPIARDTLAPPRRGVIALGAFVLASGCLAAGQGLAAAGRMKLAQGDVGYQLRPNAGQRCDQCRNWIDPNTCRLVAGRIEASGWCSLFAPRARA